MMAENRCSDAEPASPTAPSVVTLSRDPLTELNARVKARYDELMHEGKHGHYETLFRVVQEEVTLAQNLSYLRGQVDQYDDPLSPETIERFRRSLAPQPERVSPGSAPNTDAPRQNTADPEGSA